VTILEASELYRFYHSGDDETFALRGVSLHVEGGEMVAVVGPSGSGKSTLLNCLAGLDEPDGGWVAVEGRRLTRRPETKRDEMRGELIGVLLQSANLLDHLSVIGNVRIAQAFGKRAALSDPATLLDEVGLRHRTDAFPSTLSGGEATRAALAVALANNPPLLLADEPTGEVDHEAERALIDLLLARTSRGGAVVVVTHSDEVAAAAHRVVQLVDGRTSDA
jgi:putative ABC transport system ATP-binding protein